MTEEVGVIAQKQAAATEEARKLVNLAAYNDFMQHILSLPQEKQDAIFHAASKLWDALALPNMLNALALVSAELAVMSDNGELSMNDPIPKPRVIRL